MGFKGYTTLTNGVNNIFDNSIPILIKYVSFTFNAGSYDDDETQTLVGSQFVSGIVFPIRNKFGSQEALLLEQGVLFTKDKALFINGSVSLSGNVLIGLGNPVGTGEVYSVVPNGIFPYTVGGSTIYNKVFIRNTIPGSLF
jgi:hypothetical protein